MSYWVYLFYKDEKEPAAVAAHSEGGTYVSGGTTRAELNVTYNYGAFYFETIDRGLGLRFLDGKLGKETIAVLQDAVHKLGVERDSDYWAGTRGNAGHALSVLLGWARQHPEARFKVS